MKMTKIINYPILFNIMITGLFLVNIMACKEMDSTYKDLIVPGGIVYPGKAASPQVYPGHNRVKISWFRGSDPSVVKARIFWNNYTDSVEVDVPTGKDTISCILEDLPENTYSFFIRTYDKAGNISIPVEVLGTVYGEQYQASILNRSIELCSISETAVTVEWGAADTTSVYATEVKYTDNAGEEKVLYTPGNESVLTIPDMKKGTTFRYRTIYVPDYVSIDTFYTSFTENTKYFLDKSNWRVIAFSSQHNSTEANRVTNIIDGKPGTRWHTNASTSYYPHFVTVDMGFEWIITGFEIFRMKDDDRACDTFQLFTSTDNATWVDLGVFDFNRLINDGQFYEIQSHPQARYFKFVGLTGPQKYMVMGEISAYGM